MRCLSQSKASGCNCGERMMMKAGFWKCRFNHAGTTKLRWNWCANCWRNRAFCHPRLWQINFLHMVLHWGNRDYPAAMTLVAEWTIAQRIPNSRYEDENVTCNGSIQQVLPSYFSQFILQSTTTSTFNAIWFHEIHSAGFGVWLQHSGAKYQWLDNCLLKPNYCAYLKLTCQCHKNCNDGAGSGNRTRIFSLEGLRLFQI